VTLALVSIAAAAAATAGARALAQAPIPADTADRMAVRHAMRSASIMALIGASVMVSGAVGAKLAGAAVMLDAGAPLLVRVINGLAVGIGALATFWGAMWTLTTIPRLAPFSRTCSSGSGPDGQDARRGRVRTGTSASGPGYRVVEGRR
jgi:hypothetical protein